MAEPKWLPLHQPRWIDPDDVVSGNQSDASRLNKATGVSYFSLDPRSALS